VIYGQIIFLKESFYNLLIVIKFIFSKSSGAVNNYNFSSGTFNEIGEFLISQTTEVFNGVKETILILTAINNTRMFNLSELAVVIFNNFTLKYGGMSHIISTVIETASVTVNSCIVQKIGEGFFFVLFAFFFISAFVFLYLLWGGNIQIFGLMVLFFFWKYFLRYGVC
jgi:hypothetical protein